MTENMKSIVQFWGLSLIGVIIGLFIVNVVIYVIIGPSSDVPFWGLPPSYDLQSNQYGEWRWTNSVGHTGIRMSSKESTRRLAWYNYNYKKNPEEWK